MAERIIEYYIPMETTWVHETRLGRSLVISANSTGRVHDHDSSTMHTRVRQKQRQSPVHVCIDDPIVQDLGLSCHVGVRSLGVEAGASTAKKGT